MTFGVIGLGYVGLPLAIEAARSGIKVLGFDVKESVAKGINDGLSHIQDLTHREIEEQVEAGRLEATTDHGRKWECDAK